MTHKIFRLVGSLFLALAFALAGFSPALAAPPANDNFANAEVITALPFTATVDITDTTIEPGEPQSCRSMQRTVWYSFTPTETMALRADTLGGAITGNVAIWLASGPGVSDLSFVECTINIGFANLYLDAGKTYYLQAGSASGEVGSVQINLEQIFPPVNDNFADAEAIASLPFTATVDITDAFIELNEPQSCRFMEKTVWYSFTPTETMAVRADTLGSAITGNVNIYLSSGPGISDLSLLGCSIISGGGSFNFFQAEAGKTYYLHAGSREVGSIQINLERVLPLAQEVSIDIKPGRFPNRIKLTKNVCRNDDNLYVAILTTPTFNARTVDVSSIQLGDPKLSGKATPIKSRITNVDGDSDKDMVLTFTLCGIVTNGALNTSSTEMVLTGKTLEGVSITGTDSVKIVR